jgi:predicted nucleotidyltransferase
MIILFGSQARGDAGPDSDVDLLVVMPVQGSLVEKRLEVRAALHSIPVPLDVVVTSPEEFAWRKNRGWMTPTSRAPPSRVLMPRHGTDTI